MALGNKSSDRKKNEVAPLTEVASRKSLAKNHSAEDAQSNAARYLNAAKTSLKTVIDKSPEKAADQMRKQIRDKMKQIESYGAMSREAEIRELLNRQNLYPHDHIIYVKIPIEDDRDNTGTSISKIIAKARLDGKIPPKNGDATIVELDFKKLNMPITTMMYMPTEDVIVVPSPAYNTAELTSLLLDSFGRAYYNKLRDEKDPADNSINDNANNRFEEASKKEAAFRAKLKSINDVPNQLVIEEGAHLLETLQGIQVDQILKNIGLVAGLPHELFHRYFNQRILTADSPQTKEPLSAMIKMAIEKSGERYGRYTPSSRPEYRVARGSDIDRALDHFGIHTEADLYKFAQDTVSWASGVHTNPPEDILREKVLIFTNEFFARNYASFTGITNEQLTKRLGEELDSLKITGVERHFNVQESRESLPVLSPEEQAFMEKYFKKTSF